MDNKLGYNSTDDIILIEEKENLEDNLTKIRNKKDKLLEDMSNYRKEQSSYRNDYENHDAFMNYGSMIVSTNDEIKSITEIENSPYFGHMYLLEKKYFIVQIKKIICIFLKFSVILLLFH